MSPDNAATNLVLGAGVQGVLVALMLARRGQKVTLIDRAPAMLQASSLNYEGRIHLGLIYAMDTTLATGKRMVQDALHFAPVIDRLVGHPLDWAALRSTPSRYLVHEGSHLDADALGRYYTDIEAEVLSGLETAGTSYLGQRPDRIFKRTAVPEGADPKQVKGCFDTAEACVDQPLLNGILRVAVEDHPLITLSLNTTVTHIEEGSKTHWNVEAVGPGGTPERLRAARVINCLWEERSRFDARVGLPNLGQVTMRLKYSLMVRNTPALQRLGSLILVLGAYGSVVTMPGAANAFISWYPACQHGLMPVGEMPQDWRRACAGVVDKADAQAIWAENIAGFRQVFPDFGEPELVTLKAGVILASGYDDIDRTDSGFHRRNSPPFRRQGNYLSVATGKYTSAPRNAALLEQALFED